MRATLTNNEDIAVRIRELRRRRGHSLKQVINRLLREGLRNSRRTPDAKPYRTKPHRLALRPGFDTVGFNRLVDELEAEERRDREIRCANDDSERQHARLRHRRDESAP